MKRILLFKRKLTPEDHWWSKVDINIQLQHSQNICHPPYRDWLEFLFLKDFVLPFFYNIQNNEEITAK